jgi:hypothetical protein
MSLTSQSILPYTINIGHVFQVIEWLGYESFENDSDSPDLQRSYYWTGEKQFQSFVGIELYVYKNETAITIDTRTRSGRSYWDIKQQNKTIKTLYDFFGGSFITDDGENVLFECEDKEPTLLESGLFLQRWIYHNAIGRLHIYKMNSTIQGNPKITGISWMDDMNARVISNNLQIPFLVGAWENYLKSTFVVLLKCASNKRKILKGILNKIKITPDDVDSFSQDGETVEWLLANWLSFQRPKAIIENYGLVDKKIDINGTFLKPLADQNITLYDRINHVVDIRNDIVHGGIITANISDSVIEQYINDFTEAADRIYHCLGDHNKVQLSEDY